MTWLRRNWWIVGLALIVGVVLLSPLASRSPDGLQRVAVDHGVAGQEKPSPLNVIPHYLFPGIHDPRLAKIISGLIGTAVVFGLAWGAARVMSSKK